MRYPTISIHTIIEDYLDFSGHEGELDETWVLKQANDAVERLSTDQQLVHVIEILDVKNYKTKLPDKLQYICQAAYRIESQNCCSREEISQFTQKVLGTDCELEINIKCPQCHQTSCSCDQAAIEVDVNRIYETAHPEYFTRYMDHFYRSGGNTIRGTRSYYHPGFYLMKKTSNHFFNIPYHIDECINLRTDCAVEYDIHHPNLVVNFKEGEVLLSYLAVATDEDGYRLIPNVEVVFEAINYYIEERMAFRKYRQTREQKDRIFWQQMKELREKHIARARTQLQTPAPDEWWQFVENHWRKVLPYYNWYENYNRGTRDKFMYPDQTRNLSGYSSPRYRGRYE